MSGTSGWPTCGQRLGGARRRLTGRRKRTSLAVVGARRRWPGQREGSTRQAASQRGGGAAMAGSTRGHL
uniref:Uncharacterized protein n=1 Tax=Setaria italica TaxID=4555 RepID=K3ZKT9_SETIT